MCWDVRKNITRGHKGKTPHGEGKTNFAGGLPPAPPPSGSIVDHNGCCPFLARPVSTPLTGDPRYDRHLL